MAGELAGFSRDNAKLILDVVRYLRANGLVGPPSDRGQQRFPPQAPIYVRNDSGVEIPAFACLQTTGTVEYGGQNYITVDKPSDTDGTSGGYLFNGQAPIEIGGYGIAHDGPVVRMICGDTIASGDSLTPIVNDWEVEAGDGPFVAIGEDDIATNCVRGFVAMGGSGGGANLFRFELTADFTTGTTVAATIKTMGGSTVGTGISLTDPEAIFLGLPTGSKGYCVLQGGTYYAIQAACAAEEGYV
jgi:hypothetical protein